MKNLFKYSLINLLLLVSISGVAQSIGSPNSTVTVLGKLKVNKADTVTARPTYLYVSQSDGTLAKYNLDSISSGGSLPSFDYDSTYYLGGDGLFYPFSQLIVHDTCCGDSHISNDTFFVSHNGLVIQDGLVQPGYVTWSGSGLTFDVTGAIYVINGITYQSAAGQVTSDPADPDNPRIDVVAVDTTGNIVIIAGDAGPNPTEPQIDPASQVLLTSILIPAGATEPPGVTQTIIYDENTENFTGTTSGITLNLDNTINTYHLTKSANVGTWTTTRNIVFTQNSGTSDATDYSMFKMYVWLKQPLASTGNIRVAFLNGTTVVSTTIIFNTAIGFDKTLDSVWQNISIPMSSFHFTNNTFNKVRITLTGPGDGLYFDYVQLQGGIYPPADGNPFVINYSKNATNDSTILLLSNGQRLAASDRIGTTDTTSLSNRINLKVNISDTAAMLSPYLRSNVAAATYRTQAQVRSDISLTTTGSSGAATYNNTTGVLNVPQYSGGTTTNALTFNNGGSGDASGTTFDGSAARTLSYNSIGAVPTTRTINGTALSSNVTLTLASSQFANQGTTTTVLHGNASGNTSWAQIAIADLSATGTPSSSTYLRGDNTWATVSGSGTPAGNYGNIQLNRNSAFATPASDSLTYTSAAGLTVLNNGIFGNITSTATATPLKLSLGATYGNNAAYSADNLKFVLGDAATAASRNGIGFTSSLYDIHGSTGGVDIGISINNGTQVFRAFNITGNVKIGSTSTTDITGYKLQVGGGAIFGVKTSNGTTAPQQVSFGGDYGTNSAFSPNNLKWVLYEDGASTANSNGIGFSANLYDIHAGSTTAIALTTNNGTQALRAFSSGRVAIGTSSSDDNTNILQVGGSLKVTGSNTFAYVSKATSYNITIGDNTIEVTATGQTMTLPTAVGISGRVYTIKLTASGSCTVATSSSQNIDASTTYSLSAQYKYVTVQSNGANWLIIANN